MIMAWRWWVILMLLKLWWIIGARSLYLCLRNFSLHELAKYACFRSDWLLLHRLAVHSHFHRSIHILYFYANARVKFVALKVFYPTVNSNWSTPYVILREQLWIPNNIFFLWSTHIYLYFEGPVDGGTNEFFCTSVLHAACTFYLVGKSYVYIM